MSPQTLRIVVVDDHEVVREGLRAWLDSAPGMKVVGDAATGRDALRLTRELRPDVVVLDLRMPGASGEGVARRIREEVPDTRILVLTMHATRGYVSRLLEAGADGYALKSSALERVREAIRAVAAGRTWIDPELAGEVLARHRRPLSSAASPSTLSPREEEVLRKLAWGHSNKEIGEMLGISTRTVETYRARIGEKLDLRERVDMVRYALDRGWLTVEADA